MHAVIMQIQALEHAAQEHTNLPLDHGGAGSTSAGCLGDLCAQNGTADLPEAISNEHSMLNSS